MTEQQYELNEAGLIALEKQTLVALVMHHSARTEDLVTSQNQFSMEIMQVYLKYTRVGSYGSEFAREIEELTFKYAYDLVAYTHLLAYEIKAIAGLPGVTQQ